jgi:hypothetical protein
MSPPSSRPPVPRPLTRKSSAPPPAPVRPPAETLSGVGPEDGASELPPSYAKPISVPPPATVPKTPASVRDLPKAYQSEPPVIRDRVASSVELADDDLVEEPIALVRKSTPPPPPRASSKPPSSSPIASYVAPAPVAVAAPPRIEVAPSSPADSEPSSTIRPSAGAMRASAHDPLDVLFDGLYEMEFTDNAWQAADVCAATLARAVGAKAVVVHAHDLLRRELRAIGVFGPRAHDVLGSLEPSEDDFVASAAICNQKPLSMKFDGELPRLAPARLGTVGAERSLVAVPVLAWSRCVALIEVIDADEIYEARVADAIAYVAERLAEFLSERAAA